MQAPPRRPEIMFPKPLTIAVKRALRRPVYAPVRTPVGAKDWITIFERIA
jgi:hypothetical protein